MKYKKPKVKLKKIRVKFYLTNRNLDSIYKNNQLADFIPQCAGPCAGDCWSCLTS